METLEIIRNLCKERGMTISGLEKKLGYGNTSLSRAKNISSNRIVEIANFFNVSVDYILGQSDDPDYRPHRYTIPVHIPNKVIDDFMEESLIEGDSVYEQAPSYSAKQIQEALNLYEKYKKAIPQVQAAVETLLKDSQSDS